MRYPIQTLSTYSADMDLVQENTTVKGPAFKLEIPRCMCPKSRTRCWSVSEILL